MPIDADPTLLALSPSDLALSPSDLATLTVLTAHHLSGTLDQNMLGAALYPASDALLAAVLRDLPGTSLKLIPGRTVDSPPLLERLLPLALRAMQGEPGDTWDDAVNSETLLQLLALSLVSGGIGSGWEKALELHGPQGALPEGNRKRLLLAWYVLIKGFTPSCASLLKEADLQELAPATAQLDALLTQRGLTTKPLRWHATG